MYKVINLVEKLNFINVKCDVDEINKLIRVLRIEPIYEDDATKELYFDDFAFEKLKKTLLPKPIKNKSVEVSTQKMPPIQTSTKNNVQKSQQESVSVLAEVLATKIKKDLADVMEKSNFIQEAIKAGELKRDNQIISDKVKELVQDNKRLAQKLKQLEKELTSYHQVFNNIYIKKGKTPDNNN